MQDVLNQVFGYLHGMWRYRWSALLIAWVAAVVGWLIVLSMPNKYTTLAVVYVDTTSVIKPLLAGLAPETDASDELNVMSRMLLSRENLLEVIRETDMDLKLNTPAERDQLAEKLSKSIQVTGGAGRGRSNIYEISYESVSPEQAYRVVSNLLNTMIESTLNSTRTDTVAAQKFLDTQIAEYEKRLTTAETRLAEFKKANIGYMPDEKGNYYGRLQRAQDDIESIKAKIRIEQQRYSELNKQLRGESPILENDKYRSATSLKLRDMREKLDALLNQYTEEHPDVKALRASIAELLNNKDEQSDAMYKAELDEEADFNPVYQEIKVEMSKARVEVETLKTQLADQKRLLAKLKTEIDIIPEVEARLTKLNRDYEVTHERYLSLVERRESAQLAQDAGASTSDVSFRVIDPPVVPSRPSGPKRPLFLAAATLFAMGAGLGWSLLLYLLKPTYISTDQLRQNLSLPILGSVTLYFAPAHRERRRKQLTYFFATAAMLGLVSITVFLFQDFGSNVMGTLISSVTK